MAEKHRFSAPATTNEEIEVGIEDEEIYENIEAPKFVDFTKPDHNRNRTDDRYWFCLRVGCDQKHEEELDHETISKNFVLRVMAARSPNVRLSKFLNRKTPRPLKCPLSVPAKPSKSRLSRLTLISSFSKKKKLVDNQKDKLQQQQKQKPSNPNLNSTPKLQKVRTVAAKYLTTPRNRKSLLPKPNSFHSVQNNKKPSRISVPKNGRVIAKTLLFSSPKKGINLKSSAELKTPLSKICKGMKKLRLEQSVPIESARKQGTSIIERSKIKKVACSEKNVKTKSKEESSKKKPINSKSNEHGELLEKERTVIIHEADVHVPSVGNYDEEEDDKENALISESNNNSKLNDNGAQIFEKENIVGSKKETNNSKQQICQAKEQISKDGMKKYKKLKVTNPKPFRLRTDERGILKEAILERKILTPVPQKEEAATVSTCSSNTTKYENGSLEKKKKSPPSPSPSPLKPKGSTTTTTTTRTDVKQLSPIKEKDKSRKTLKEASSASAKSISRGKRPPMTVVPKESNQKAICQQKDRTVIRI